MSKIKEFLGEKAGQQLRAEIHSDDESYKIIYYIGDSFLKQESFEGKNIYFVEDAAQNWISGIKVLNG